MAEQSALPGLWEVPQELRDRLGKHAGRQRALRAEGHLLLVLHRPPKADDVKRHARYFWRKPDGTWSSNDLGGGPRALEQHLSEYADLVEEYDEQQEAAQSAEDCFTMLGRLAPVHRAARNMHQTLQEAHKMVPPDRGLINFRDHAYEIERTAELLYQETRHALDFTMARRAEQQARSSRHMALSAYRLNLLAAFFFPVATFSALFGMNLGHGFEKHGAPIPFFCVLFLGLMFGFVLTAFVTRPPREEAATTVRPEPSLWDRLRGPASLRPGTPDIDWRSKRR